MKYYILNETNHFVASMIGNEQLGTLGTLHTHRLLILIGSSRKAEDLLGLNGLQEHYMNRILF
jgi:hypothetical protein